MPDTRRLIILAFWTAALVALVMACLPQPPKLWTDPDDSLQHFTAFATIATLARIGYPRAQMLTLLLAITAFGGLIELVQMIPALGRDSSFDDWMVDMAATSIALVLLEPLFAGVEERGSAPQHMIYEPAQIAKAA